MNKADVGIFGGSGFYEFFKNAEEISLETPHGKPSDSVFVAEIAGKKAAFLPRHGRGHKLPPHKIPYKANLWAMKELGVSKIIAPSAAGSLKKEIKPGDFVICDQYVDFTRGAREDTFFDGQDVRHISQARPYCEKLRKLAADACRKNNVAFHPSGTTTVINGPRFSTIAESQIYKQWNCSVINMTQYPEVVLANELGICYVNLALVTDYDAWAEAEKGLKASDAGQILETFRRNIENLKKVLMRMLEDVDLAPCHDCLEKPQKAKFS